jgi:hypothetical protein
MSSSRVSANAHDTLSVCAFGVRNVFSVRGLDLRVLRVVGLADGGGRTWLSIDAGIARRKDVVDVDHRHTLDDGVLDDAETEKHPFSVLAEVGSVSIPAGVCGRYALVIQHEVRVLPIVVMRGHAKHVLDVEVVAERLAYRVVGAIAQPETGPWARREPSVEVEVSTCPVNQS